VRPGAILSGVSVYKYNKKFAGFNLTDADQACTPKSALPDGVSMLKTLTYNYNISADAALTLEIEKVITGISLSAEYLDQISIKITDSKLYIAQTDDIGDAIDSIKARPKCAPVFKSRPKKDNFLDAPIIVKNACVGNIKLDYKWKKAVHAAFLQAQLGSLKVGFSANFNTSNLEETPCPPPASPQTNPADKSGTKTGDTPATKAKSGATPAAANAAGSTPGTPASSAQIKDAVVAGLNALADYLKKLADEAVAKNLPDAADKVAAAAKAKADAVAAAAAPATPATPAADAGKCYVGYSIESQGPVVFGVTSRNVSQYENVKP
jgi:hypothetical protein